MNLHRIIGLLNPLRTRKNPTSCRQIPSSGTRERSPTYLHTSSSTPSIQSVQYTGFKQERHMLHPAALARDDVLLLPRPTLPPEAYPRLVVRKPRSLRLPIPLSFNGFASRLAVSVAGVITPANNATCSLRLALLLSARLYMTSSGDHDTRLAASVHGKAAVRGHGLWRVQNSSDETKTAVDNAKKAAAGF